MRRQTPSRSDAGHRLAQVFLFTLALTGLAAGTAAAQVRITEVLADPAGSNTGTQKVEIANFGVSPVDISGWQICVQFQYNTFPLAIDPLDPGEIYVIHIRGGGTSDDNNFHTTPTFPLLDPVDDSFGLYDGSGFFTDPNALVDYVGWGAGSQARENVAVSAGVWAAGDFVPSPAEGNSIQLCDETSHASSAWKENAPTIAAANDCSDPKPQVILSEVLVDPVEGASGNQKIEIQNLEAAPIDLSDWQICFQFLYWPIPAGTTVAAGDFLVIHLNASGTDDASNVFTGPLADLSVAADGLGLYLPVTNDLDFGDPAFMVDFVQWGASGQPREDVAAAAGIWGAGDFLAAPAPGRSLERCAAPSGVGSWSETPDQTLGATNSCDPTGVPGGRPLVHRVGQPHPNPLLGETRLEFELSRPARVVARVLDLRGRVVATIADRTFPAGVSSLAWSGAGASGRRLPAGVYHLDLASPEAVGTDGAPWRTTRRVVLLGTSP